MGTRLISGVDKPHFVETLPFYCYFANCWYVCKTECVAKNFIWMLMVSAPLQIFREALCPCISIPVLSLVFHMCSVQEPSWRPCTTWGCWELMCWISANTSAITAVGWSCTGFRLQCPSIQLPSVAWCYWWITGSAHTVESKEVSLLMGGIMSGEMNKIIRIKSCCLLSQKNILCKIEIQWRHSRFGYGIAKG